MPLSPNMNLPISVAGVSTGLEWETNLNASLSILDQHNHTAGQGVTIPPSGLNINADLPFNGNNATTLRSTRYTPQASALALASDLGCVYVAGVDLWFNDVNGNQVQLTTGGAVNATSSGISSGTATASFVSSVLVVNAASNTPANIQAGSILLGNNVAASKFLTLAPPNAMAANYGLVLPALPGTTNIMALDPSGNITAPYSVDNSSIEITANTIQVKDQGIQQEMLAPRTTGTTVGIGGVALSASSGNVVITTDVPTNINNLSVTITTSGRPVRVELVSDVSGGLVTTSYINITGSNTSTGYFIDFYRGVTAVSSYQVGPGPSKFFPSSCISTLDFPAAGTYTYTAKGYVDPPSGGTKSFFVNFAKLCVYEI